MNLDKDIVKMLLDEEIKDIPFTNGLYQISSKGYIISYCNKPTMIVGTPNSQGYLVASIKNRFGNYETKYIHSLVASAFVPNDDPVNKVEIHHKDCNKQNNDYKNLQFVSWDEHIKIHQELREKQKKDGQDNGQL